MDTLEIIHREARRLPNEQLRELLKTVENVANPQEVKQHNPTTRLPAKDSQ